MKVRWLFVAWGILAAWVLLLRFGVVGPREWLITLYAVGSLALAGGLARYSTSVFVKIFWPLIELPGNTSRNFLVLVLATTTIFVS